MDNDIRVLDVAELDQVSGGTIPGWTPELAKVMNDILLGIAAKEVSREAPGRCLRNVVSQS